MNKQLLTPEQLRVLGSQVAQCLNEIEGTVHDPRIQPWQAGTKHGENEHVIPIFKDEGFRFFLCQNVSHDTLLVVGAYPSAKDGYSPWLAEPAPEIRLSASKGPKKIANDILKRFLPTYLTRYAKCNVGVKEYERSNLVAQSAADKLAVGFAKCTKDLGACSVKLNFSSLEGTATNWWGQANVTPNDVKIEVHNLSHEQASSLLKVLKSFV